MNQVATENEQQESTGAGALSGPDALPSLRVPHAPEDVIARLRKRSKRGKLAGFEVSGPPGTFSVAAFGNPYDRRLVGSVAPADQGSMVTFESVLLRKLPTLMIVVVIFTIWPGVLLTDSLLTTWFSWYPQATWVTYAWYIPLCLLAIPVLWKQYKTSNALAHEHALEQIDAMAKELDATRA
ncbi:MAG: hypothetical protein AAFX05_07690 [Planctomycetota bacterium]